MSGSCWAASPGFNIALSDPACVKSDHICVKHSRASLLEDAEMITAEQHLAVCLIVCAYMVVAIAAMSAEAARQSRNPGPAEYDVLPHVQALSSHPRAPAPGFGSEGRQCNKAVGTG